MSQNPYHFPTPALISFSGGRTSAYMLKKIIDAHNGELPADCHVVFANTGKEVEQTLEFIQKVSDMWSVDITWLELDIFDEKPIYRNKIIDFESASRNGEPFEKLIRRKKMLPNPVMRICTAELKMAVLNRFMRSQGYKEWSNVVGLRYDEPRRVANQRRSNELGKNKYWSYAPLFDDQKTVRDVAEFWKKSNFDLDLPNYGGKTLVGNCDLCYLKGTQTKVQILKEKPELADWWIKMEEFVAQEKKSFGSNYKATFQERISYIDLLKLSEQKKIDLLDDDTRSCFCTD